MQHYQDLTTFIELNDDATITVVSVNRLNVHVTHHQDHCYALDKFRVIPYSDFEKAKRTALLFIAKSNKHATDNQ